MTVSVFWDLYCAAPERHDTCEHSSEAKAFHDYGFVNSGYGVNGISHNSNKWGTLIYNTLIEHYLQIWYKLSDTMNRLQYEQKIMRLLESPDSNCDKHHALILCQAVNFRAGLLYLYEENKMYQQILQYHLCQKDYQNVITCCRRFDQSHFKDLDAKLATISLNFHQFISYVSIPFINSAE
ncbi:vacuolar protein sorting-associated protein 11 homolog isoform X2 [Lycorma delicatula]|uniref:vacuolar protein sorting-associated protein 11 homolog isoform X2 n=1 Tax=Lycorma delicatula TaxID=130591 RepID=UPI003F50E71D